MLIVSVFLRLYNARCCAQCSMQVYAERGVGYIKIYFSDLNNHLQASLEGLNARFRLGWGKTQYMRIAPTIYAYCA